jgi:hypothetical protein
LRFQIFLLGIIFLLCATPLTFGANKADCNGSGDLVPFADLFVSKDTLETQGAVELMIKTSTNAKYLRMFYVDADGNLKTLILAPLPADVPSQTKQIGNIRRTTTVALVAKTDTGAMTCVLSVPFTIPQETKHVSVGEWCPPGFALSRAFSSQGAECARVMPAFATDTIAEYNPQPPGTPTGNYASCGVGYYALDGDMFISGGSQSKCRTDGWKDINPLGVTFFANGNCDAYSTAGEVRFAVAAKYSLPNPWMCASRKLQIPEDSAATKKTVDAANAYAASR